jgi:hypothetical protein
VVDTELVVCSGKAERDAALEMAGRIDGDQRVTVAARAIAFPARSTDDPNRCRVARTTRFTLKVRLSKKSNGTIGTR